MKRWKIWVPIVIALVVVLAVIFMTPLTEPKQNRDGKIAEGTAIQGPEQYPNATAEPPDFWLWAGQTTLVGTGNVTRTSTSPDFSINTDCAIYYLHIRIWDGTPVAGEQKGYGVSPPWHHVDYTSSPQIGSFVFSIPIDPFPPAGWEFPISIAIHADVVCGFYEGNTAWAGGSATYGECEEFGGTPWAYYFYYNPE